MRSLIRVAVVVMSLFVCLNEVRAAPSEWTIDWVHSGVFFDVRHTYAIVRGQFDSVSGTFVFDPENVGMSNCSLEVKVKSINTNNRKRDDHLRSSEFFAVKEFPVMNFKSERVRQVDGGRFEVEGELTVKDVSKNVVIPFTYYGVKENPLKPEQLVAGFEAKFAIDRLEYHVGEGKFYEMGAIAKDVAVTITLEVLRDK